MVGLLDLPVEIVLLIAGSLLCHEEVEGSFAGPQSDLNSLIQTNRQLYNLFQDELYESNVRYHRQTALAFGAYHGNRTIVEKTLEVDKSKISLAIPSWCLPCTVHTTHEPVCWAAQGGQTAMIQHLLDCGATFKPACLERGRCECETGLLGQAAKNGHLETMKYLLAMGLKVESRRELKHQRPERRGVTPLRMAVENGQKNCIDFILREEGYLALRGKEYVHRIALIVAGVGYPPAEVNHQSLDSALFLLKQSKLTQSFDFCRCLVDVASAISKDLPKLSQILEMPGNFELYADMLLYLAVMSGHVPLLDEMVRLGVSVETRFRGGHTPISLAALEGGPDIATRLLELGADLNVKNDKDQSPFFLATLSRALGVMEVFLHHGADINASSTRCGIIQTPLFRAVADIERSCLIGRNMSSPRRAGRSSASAVVEFLLQNGADPNFRDPTYGMSPFWLAIRACSPLNDDERIRALIEHGADVHVAQRRRSILCDASRHYSIDTIKLLLEKGVDPNDYGEDFSATKTYHRGVPLSPLAKCMKYGWSEQAVLLLDFGADPHALHWKKETCLVKAATFGSYALVAKLLEKGVDVNESFNGKTALDIAVWRRNAELTELLLRWGAKPTESAKERCIVSKTKCRSEEKANK
ncbi:unnamed protein product [Penicillium salamii]|uniref:Ankyrin repeat-containing domain-containing protein n=1 Tax=Penicillium salamii TaxID=1612424 RepID=A0A9W4IYP0_9EURO|nr:unnamed protein product [Penicillium salamii]CAG8357326.1 unnamed protein product [Penicillium salamii]CAG8368425.1 unnamed protein product [Penicillium salamii]CAG8398556.1 unnamed protein product [Penicillium salamii]